MEAIVDGVCTPHGRVRLHVAPEGLALVDRDGLLLASAPYESVTDASFTLAHRSASLHIALAERSWTLRFLHPLQARFGADLIQEQLAALRRRALPAFNERRPLAEVGPEITSFLATAELGVVQSVDFLLAQATMHGASDLHLEPYPSEFRIRFRVDGVLHDVAAIPTLWLPRFLARLKVLANLAVYRSDVPQEGRICLRLGDRSVDIRLSLLPTLHGEKAVLRLFDPARSRLALDGLGMNPEVEAAWRAALDTPQGMLLLTGPSSHGKTTTLYASLIHLHTTRRDLSSLCTVEDPIEHDLRLINQTQVNNAVGLTFAAGLRTVLRQDPEVIMVGEVRDEETAGIAVRAGLTGHLILSTVHARTAGGVFARLIDLGVEPYLVASAVTGVMAQRLVRTLCPECSRPVNVEPARWRKAGATEDGAWREAAGCAECDGTGHRGRTGVFHLIRMDAALSEAVIAGRSAAAIQEMTGGDGLRREAIRLAAAGRVSLSEVERVIGPGEGSR